MAWELVLVVALVLELVQEPVLVVDLEQVQALGQVVELVQAQELAPGQGQAPVLVVDLG